MENTLLLSSTFPIIFPIQQNKHNLGVGRLLILGLSYLHWRRPTVPSFADFVILKCLKVFNCHIFEADFSAIEKTFLNKPALFLFFSSHLLVLAVKLCGYCRENCVFKKGRYFFAKSSERKILYIIFKTSCKSSADQIKSSKKQKNLFGESNYLKEKTL